MAKAFILAATIASYEFERSLEVPPAACVGPYFLIANKYRSLQCMSDLFHLVTFADVYLSCLAEVKSRQVQEQQPLFFIVHRF